MIPLSTRAGRGWQIVWQGSRLGFVADGKLRYHRRFEYDFLAFFFLFCFLLFFFSVRATAVIRSSSAGTSSVCVIHILPHLIIPLFYLFSIFQGLSWADAGGPTHQFFIRWAAVRPCPSNFNLVGRGPARPVNFQMMGRGPAQPITFSNFTARPGPSFFQKSRPGPARPITWQRGP